VTDKGYGKMTKVIDNDGEPTYRITKRGTKGVSTLKASDKVGNLVAVRAVNLDDDLMVITNAGIVIRTPLNQIRVASRNTQGVKIMNLEGRQRVASVAIVPFEEDEPEEAPVEEGAEEAPQENVEE
jgi:DNA gyrase subunit A